MTCKKAQVLCLVLLVLVFYVSACTPDPIYVGCYINELVAAVNDANLSPNANVINLEAGCPYLFTSADNNMDASGQELGGNPANALPIITTKIIINGNGARLMKSGGVSTPDLRFFLITGDGDLTLNQMSLEDGYLFSYTANFGGAIANYGGVLTVDEVEFLQNSVSHNGGALYNQDGIVSITNSTFRENTANHGGAILNQGTIDIGGNNLFEDNAADSYGGAISNLGSLSISGLGDPLSFYGNRFLANTAGVQGGAIYSGADGSVLSIHKAQFSENTSDRDGGAVYVGGAPTMLEISGSGFFTNQAVDTGGGISIIGTGSVALRLDDDRFEENLSGAGGAVYAFNASLDVLNGDFTENTSLSNGGAVMIQGVGDLSMRGSQLHANAADWSGGGLYSDSEGATSLEGVLAEGNSADRDGGGIYVAQGVFSISGSTIQGNQSQTGGGLYNETGVISILGDSVFENNTALSSGGGIHSTSGDVTIQDVVIRGNQSTSDGGGIYNQSEMIIETSTITGNTAGSSGGGINNYTGGTLQVFKSTFSDNEAESNGGGVYQRGNLVTLINTTVSGNHARFSPGISVSGEIILIHTTVADNIASSSGGAGISIADTGNLQAKNSIVATNFPVDCSVSGTLAPQGENLDADGTCTGFTLTADPLLSSLANNGGPTQTHALLTSSPAIDAVPDGDCTTLDSSTLVAEDQRGESRPKPTNGQCDLGAYEYDPASPPPPPPPVPFILRTTTDVNCRIGPDFGHVVVHTFTTGDTATAIGRNEDGTWFGVAAPDGSGEEGEPWCWLPDAFVQRPFDSNDLPELDHLPPPNVLEPRPPTKEPGEPDCGGAAVCP